MGRVEDCNHCNLSDDTGKKPHVSAFCESQQIISLLLQETSDRVILCTLMTQTNCFTILHAGWIKSVSVMNFAMI